MSFILEALKKSEQQRQQQNGSPQKVRQRTLSLSSRTSGRGLRWLLAGGLLLTLLGVWWLASEPATVTVPPPSIPSQEVVAVATAPAQTPASALPAMVPPAAVEPAPVPRDFLAEPVTSAARTLVPQPASVIAAEPAAGAEVATVVVAPLPRAIASAPTEPVLSELPRYLDLPRELREHMPSLTMSMHFYVADPARRLVRINDRLLHEGDWLSDDLQLVEITPSGATLDFLGKPFEMSSAGR